jgi:hypothetical protein
MSKIIFFLFLYQHVKTIKKTHKNQFNTFLNKIDFEKYFENAVHHENKHLEFKVIEFKIHNLLV